MRTSPRPTGTRGTRRRSPEALPHPGAVSDAATSGPGTPHDECRRYARWPSGTAVEGRCSSVWCLPIALMPRPATAVHRGPAGHAEPIRAHLPAVGNAHSRVARARRAPDAQEGVGARAARVLRPAVTGWRRALIPAAPARRLGWALRRRGSGRTHARGWRSRPTRATALTLPRRSGVLHAGTDLISNLTAAAVIFGKRRSAWQHVHPLSTPDPDA
jgi:hypothetical protein